MALTPEDVVNKRFQPTKFREGYDQDEVDDFLDEVVAELRRLGQENDELRQRLSSAESAGGSAVPAPVAASAPASAQAPASVQAPASAPAPESEPAPVSEPAPASVPAPVEDAPEPEAAPEPVAAAAVAPVPAYAGPSQDDTESTNSLLQLARRLHEEHVREGVEKRDALIAEGQSTSARLVAEAEAKQRDVVTEAEARSREVVAEAETKRREVLEQLATERTGLERRIDDLRTFERDYRQKLKGYIEGQLRDLEAESGEQQPASGFAPASAQGFGSN
ncbi:DivIVA domain-containing protein [Frigoribacterium sp. CFBP 13729]|uniref:DivIVA domain-containing protein n=1 Tax=unclassified Frigoribacterium TaxID=2627005 RepID=UPI00177E4AC1|nr:MULTISPECIES: DivIVA domain-containing protein [unclassified Frigoribacterium]MBD8584281.1 DivIVA domain-containing protein [Frigoribacterium sp. CFBP 8766]MBD8609040.1 DivIVA domain-containing protein [Frigoribacterium sp. CFBP 13729]